MILKNHKHALLFFIIIIIVITIFLSLNSKNDQQSFLTLVNKEITQDKRSEEFIPKYTHTEIEFKNTGEDEVTVHVQDKDGNTIDDGLIIVEANNTKKKTFNLDANKIYN